MSSFQRFELCLKEVELVQSHIARYDANGITIKSWGIATFAAASSYSYLNRSMLVALVGLLAVILLALTEMIYRCFQVRFIDRAAELESMLSSEDLGAYRFGLTSAALRTRWPSDIVRSLRQPHFWIPYLVLILGGTLLVGALAWGMLPYSTNPCCPRSSTPPKGARFETPSTDGKTDAFCREMP